jgi:hypothetical protein
VSRPHYVRSIPSGAEELFDTAMVGLRVALGAEVAAVIGLEEDGRMFLFPSSNRAAQLFRTLSEVDWEEMIRRAEEQFA